jgi:hypothetical protein
MKISLLKDLHVKDAGTDRNVNAILGRLNIAENEVVLDFFDCGVDYPATSKLIDKVLADLSLRKGKKKLTILFDLDINEFVIHKWFFLGSVFFNIPENRKDLNNAEFKRVIREKLLQVDTVLEIEIEAGDYSKKRIEYGEH